MDERRNDFVKGIFQEALDRPDAERAAFVESACGGDQDARERVMALLDAYAGADGFLPSRARAGVENRDLAVADASEPSRPRAAADGEPASEYGEAAASDDLPTARTILRVPFDGTGERELGTLELPEFADSWFGSISHAIHPDGRTFAFERHAGTAVQDWAIENLLRFIQSGETWTSVMPVLPR